MNRNNNRYTYYIVYLVLFLLIFYGIFSKWYQAYLHFKQPFTTSRKVLTAADAPPTSPPDADDAPPPY